MRTILPILLLALTASAQTNLNWKVVTKGPTLKILVAETARGPKEVKFWIRFDFPDGAPAGFPVDGVGSVRTEATFNCEKRTAKLTKGYGYFYDKFGAFITKAKDKQTVKEVPGSVGNYILEYFCEQPSKPVTAPPKLKPK